MQYSVKKIKLWSKLIKQSNFLISCTLMMMTNLVNIYTEKVSWYFTTTRRYIKCLTNLKNQFISIRNQFNTLKITPAKREDKDKIRVQSQWLDTHSFNQKETFMFYLARLKLLNAKSKSKIFRSIKISVGSLLQFKGRCRMSRRLRKMRRNRKIKAKAVNFKIYWYFARN